MAGSDNGSQGGYDPNALGQQLGTKLTSAVNKPSFGSNMFVEPSAATTGGLNALAGTANNPSFAGSAQGALDSFGKVASGADLGGNNPYFQRDLASNISDTKGDVLASLGGSGGLNSDLHIKTLTNALGGVRDRAYEGERQYQDSRQAQAAGMLGGLYQNTQAPAQTQIAAGQGFDAINTARRAGEAELYQRPTNDLLSYLQAFNGTGQNPGMAPETPWWQTALGYVAGNAGQAMKFMG